MLRARFQSLNDLGGSQGTVPLVDDAHRYKDKANTDIILIPQPSDDPNDPLNWPVWRKNAAFWSVIFFSALTNWVIAGLGVGVVQVSIEFNRDIGSVVQDTISWCILTLGIGNFFWVPLAQYFGKRPIFLTAITGLFACTIWSAKTEGYKAFVASRVLCAFFGSCTEALPAAVVQDLFFLHERGKQMGIYEGMLQAGGMFGLILAGFITDRGYRWNLWFCAIVSGVNLLWIFFLYPETLYVRNYDTGLDSAQTSVRAPTGNDEEKASATEDSDPIDAPTTSSTTTPPPPRKSFLQTLTPWSPLNPQKTTLFRVFFRPWPMVLYPGLLYSFLTFAAVLGWPICVLNTNAAIYQAPPYNFSPGINNLINLPAVIGCVIGAWSGGAFSDYLAERSARKNNGIFEPESRLVALIPSFFIVPIGLLMWGFFAEKQLHWAVGYVGYGFIIFGIGAVPTITLTYLTDSYSLISPELMLLSVGLKNIFGFGFAYGVIPWISAQGYAAAFGTMVAVHCAIMLFGIPLWYYGKRIRQATAGWKLIYG